MNKRNNLSKFLLVLGVLAWAFYEMYPPVGRDLGKYFQEHAVAVRKDTAFTNILGRFEQLQKERPLTAYANLVEAVGTNDIARYFPQFRDIAAERNPSRAVLDRLQKEAAGKIKLGLDLQGGTAFLVEMDTNALFSQSTNTASQDALEQQAISEAVEVLRKRVDQFGVAEPVIQPEGSDRILIQLPGLSDADKDRARENIKKAAHLELRLVHPDSDAIIRDNGFEPGYEVMAMRVTGRDGRGTNEFCLVKKAPEMGGEYITAASMQRDPAGRPEIVFKLNSEGADLFDKLTRANVGHRMAIVLDNELLSAPVINEEIAGGSCRISGSFTDKEAQDLANAMQNPLRAPLTILSESRVDPTLGADTVRSGVRSAIYGTLLVAGFMAVYYLLAGAVADIALMTNIVILLGVMCSIGTTLTLPGIAGVVLTIGMAVDANVLIFERIREELAKGKSLHGALAAGYDRAFRTIFDSHVTTLISSIILIYLGTGPIKGFGVTLTIGVAASLFTALVVTRLIFDFLLARNWIKSIQMLHLIRESKLDFMKLARFTFLISSIVIVAGLAYGGFGRGHQMLGIDFAGGDDLTMRFSEKVRAEDLHAAIARQGISGAQIQFQKDVARNAETVRITSPFGTGETISTNLAAQFPAAGFGVIGLEKVGPTIGQEILANAMFASLLSMVGILIYVALRYELSFAVGAIVAVLHDILFTIACYCLTGLFGEGRQFNATMVAAVLTIIGFSLNDKVVIFDRIREDLKMGVGGKFRDVINQALNQTLSRTIITSGTVFLATLSLYLFGGGAINDFAFTFLIGIITGTYSSIYIASAFVLWWHRGEQPKAATPLVPGAAKAKA